MTHTTAGAIGITGLVSIDMQVGRYVTPAYILGSTSNEDSFEDLLPHFDQWIAYRNDVPRADPPILVAQGQREGYESELEDEEDIEKEE
jgi:hypothetical protein